MHRLLGSLDRTIALLNAIADGVTAQDKNGQLIYANDAAARMSGYASPEAMLAAASSEITSRFEMLDENGQPFEIAQLPGRVVLSGQDAPERVICFRNRETGEERWSGIKAQPVLGADGEIEFVVNIVRDYTDQKRHEIRQQFLIEASATLAASLDYETTLASVAELATPKIADWCAVDLLDEQQNIQRVAVTHIDPEKVTWAYELQKRYPPSLEGDTGFAKVIKTGKSDYFPNITDELLVEAAQGNAELLDIVRTIGFRSSLIVPLTARGHTFGAITFVTTAESGRYLSQADVALAEELGHIAALAVDNSRLFDQAQSERQRFEVTLRSIGDAVIATDAAGRITFINDVAQSLTGWTESEAHGKPLATVFRIINEYSRQTVESPVEKVIREGVIVGLANHTLLITKDGNEIPIDDSGAPIVDSEGGIDGVVLVFRDITERRQTELREKELVAANERHRLARDLHDSVSQTLFTANVLAESLPRLAERNSTKVFEQLHQLHQLTQGASAEMRALLLELRPESVIKTNLEQLLRQLSLAIQARRKVNVEILAEGEGEPFLREDVHMAFYRIAQESLNNIARHANAKQARIRLIHTPERLELVIVDNGDGFDKKRPSSGFGLTSMQERATSIGAQFQIHSKPGTGTRVRLVWKPVKEPELF